MNLYSVLEIEFGKTENERCSNKKSLLVGAISTLLAEVRNY